MIIVRNITNVPIHLKKSLNIHAEKIREIAFFTEQGRAHKFTEHKRPNSGGNVRKPLINRLMNLSSYNLVG
jgi:hypothetical protein